jgi:hypothetical protein
MGFEWLPINLFRMGPTLYLDGLSLLTGMLLASVTAALILGIQWSEPQRTAWPGLILALLAGCLAVIMAANVLALALASALIDMALVAATFSLSNGTEPSQRLPLSTAVPGFASTMILVVAALQMDSSVGHASLLSQNLPQEPLVLVGVAGLLRVLVFPLHPRVLDGPQSAATLLLPVGVGGYLLVRVQALAPVLSGQPWAMIVAAVALLAGGLLTWSGSVALAGQKPVMGGFWSGTLVQQTGCVLAFVLLLAGVAPWPLVGLILALGILIIWWSEMQVKEDAPRSVIVEWIAAQIQPWRARVQAYAAARIPQLGRWRRSWFGRHGTALLPAIALASLMGAPFTVGARGRWPFYAKGLERGDTFLLVLLVADTLLAAGLWIAGFTAARQAREQRLRGAAILAMVALIILLFVWGIAPGILNDDLDIKTAEPSDISVWGLGLVYALPWLLGAWLGRMRGSLARTLDHVHDAVNLDGLYRAAGWAAERLAGVIRWLGIVGEGDGWWGWVLIVLALGVLLLAAQ